LNIKKEFVAINNREIIAVLSENNSLASLYITTSINIAKTILIMPG